MLKVLKSFARKYLSDDEAVILLLLLIAATLVVIYLGNVLAPVIAAMVIAFILQGLIARMRRWGVSQRWSLLAVYVLFLGCMVGFFLGLMPLIWTQLTSLVGELPHMFQSGQQMIEQLPFQYPHLLSVATIDDLFKQLTGEAAHMTQRVLSLSLRGIPDLFAWIIYLVLVPILVFFFLKDRLLMQSSVSRLLPRRRPLMERIWREMNMQFANYVRGKAAEILIVGGATYIVLKVMGVHYAALLSMLVGLSVVIPYIGAAVVTVPVIMVSLFQFGWSSHFLWVMIAYTVVQAIDGYVLVPLLFSEVNNLHPVVIIVAVLVFGSIWGLWGVFFAIPLATLLKAVLFAWPVHRDEDFNTSG